MIMGCKWGKRNDLNLSLLFLVLLCNLLLLTTSAEDQSPLSPFVIPATGLATSFQQSIACSEDTENTLKGYNLQCLSSSNSTNTSSSSSSSSSCDRFIRDDLFSSEETDTLLHIALKGMGNASSAGGPTILDLNTGYLRDSESGLKNLFLTRSNLFSLEDFEAYGRIIKKLKGIVESFFGISENVLFFTAPTFITRLDGNPFWQPQEV